MAYLYILRCQNGALYTGITTDLARRMRAHVAGRGAGAKYTRAFPPCAIGAVWETDAWRIAARAEYALKQLSHAQKERLCQAPETLGTCLPPALQEYVFRPVTVTLDACCAPPEKERS